MPEWDSTFVIYRGLFGFGRIIRRIMSFSVLSPFSRANCFILSFFSARNIHQYFYSHRSSSRSMIFLNVSLSSLLYLRMYSFSDSSLRLVSVSCSNFSSSLNFSGKKSRLMILAIFSKYSSSSKKKGSLLFFSVSSIRSPTVRYLPCIGVVDGVEFFIRLLLPCNSLPL